VESGKVTLSRSLGVTGSESRVVAVAGLAGSRAVQFLLPTVAEVRRWSSVVAQIRRRSGALTPGWSPGYLGRRGRQEGREGREGREDPRADEWLGQEGATRGRKNCAQPCDSRVTSCSHSVWLDSNSL